VTSFGHGQAGHFPDNPVAKFNYKRDDGKRIIRDNPAEYYNAYVAMRKAIAGFHLTPKNKTTKNTFDTTEEFSEFVHKYWERYKWNPYSSRERIEAWKKMMQSKKYPHKKCLPADYAKKIDDLEYAKVFKMVSDPFDLTSDLTRLGLETFTIAAEYHLHWFKTTFQTHAKKDIKGYLKQATD